MKALTHGSLFSGIGGFEKGAQMAGIETLWNCEIEPYNRAILKQHFPESYQYDDIRTLSRPTPVDIISGGFPCQDISSAGKGKGITGERSGLWSEMYRLIDEIRPAYVVIENSPNLLKKGFEAVLYPLSEIGYDAEWHCLQASDFGLPHQRERVYVIANALHSGLQVFSKRPEKLGRISEKASAQVSLLCSIGRSYGSGDSYAIRRGDAVPNRTHRIKALGNAVIPLISKYLFECIKQHANLLDR